MYDIRKEQNGVLEWALRGMGKSNVDVGVFQETKLTYGIYTRGSSGYKVVAMLAPSRDCSDIAILYQDSPTFSVETIRQFGVNVIAFQMVTVERCWYIFGCYLATGNDTIIWYVEAAMSERPRGEELTISGDFNVDLEKRGGQE